jgi:uncharacterized membrane protein YozB (DUF420 family)
MASTARLDVRNRLSFKGLATALAVGLFLGALLLFLSRDTPNATRHAADKQWAYWLHIAGGTLVLGVAPFQYIAPVRKRFRRYHRLAGYAFVGGTAMAAIGFMSIQPTESDLIFASQATAVALWVIAAAAAWIAARRKRFLTHRHNMTRAFVLAAYFVGVRLVDHFVMGFMDWFSANREAQFIHSDWLAWIIPLVLVEAYYGREWDALLKRRERQPLVKEPSRE